MVYANYLRGSEEGKKGGDRRNCPELRDVIAHWDKLSAAKR